MKNDQKKSATFGGGHFLGGPPPKKKRHPDKFFSENGIFRHQRSPNSPFHRKYFGILKKVDSALTFEKINFGKNLDWEIQFASFHPKVSPKHDFRKTARKTSIWRLKPPDFDSGATEMVAVGRSWTSWNRNYAKRFIFTHFLIRETVLSPLLHFFQAWRLRVPKTWFSQNGEKDVDLEAKTPGFWLGGNKVLRCYTEGRYYAWN